MGSFKVSFISGNICSICSSIVALASSLFLSSDVSFLLTGDEEGEIVGSGILIPTGFFVKTGVGDYDAPSMKS